MTKLPRSAAGPFQLRWPAKEQTGHSSTSLAKRKNAEAFQKEKYKAYLILLHLHITCHEKYHKAVDEHMKAFGEINTLVTNSAIHEACEYLYWPGCPGNNLPGPFPRNECNVDKCTQKYML
jgi:hypothetical protein